MRPEIEDIYNEIYKKLSDEKRGQIARILDKYFKEDINNYNPVGHLIRMPSQEISGLVKKINDNINDYKLTEDEKGILKKCYGCIDKNIRGMIVQWYGRKVCPYCDRNYINSARVEVKCPECGKKYYLENIKGKCLNCEYDISSIQTEIVNTAQLDHIFAISKYPMFSISISNLIPVCASCNRIKNDYDQIDAEYLDKPLSENINFSYTLESFNKKKIIIKSKAAGSNASSFEGYIEHMKIKEIYQEHVDVIDQIEWKYNIYNQFYKDKLSKISGLNISEEDIEILICGEYSMENIGKVPLSIMKTQIWKEINENRSFNN